MSQYLFRAAGHEIVVGWDNPLETFFVQVWDESSDTEDPVLRKPNSLSGPSTI